jgi:hypothetical protein
MVQLMPKDSALVHCVRAYARYRMMIGLHCMTEERIARLKRYIADYKTLCSVSDSVFRHLLHLSANLFRSV